MSRPVPIKGLKENMVDSVQKEQKITHTSKDTLQRLGGKQVQCGSDRGMAEIRSQANVCRIQIDQDHISGTIPKSFAKLEKLKHLHMNNNSINGEIPPELSKLPILVHFLLDNNNLSGSLPPELSQLPNLHILESEGSFQYGNYRREAEDLRAVVVYFSGLKREISAILGHSKGGNVVLLYASKYRDVHTVVNICGRFALERGIEGRLGKEIMQRIKKDGFFDVKDKTVPFCNQYLEHRMHICRNAYGETIVP